MSFSLSRPLMLLMPRSEITPSNTYRWIADILNWMQKFMCKTLGFAFAVCCIVRMKMKLGLYADGLEE